jgi:hypothetical protein
MRCYRRSMLRIDLSAAASVASNRIAAPAIATYASMVRPRGRAAERGTLGEQHHPLGNEQMSKESIWSGLALIIAGGLFIAGNPWRGTGSSKLGLIVG